MPWGQLYFSLNGRATRRDFWLRLWVPLILAEMVLIAVSPPVSPFFKDLPLTEAEAHPWALLTPLGYAHFALLNLAFGLVAVKRLHDRGRSGWLLLIFGLPILAALLPDEVELIGRQLNLTGILGLICDVAFIWLFIELGFLRGSRGPNRFGADPLEAAAAPLG